MKKTTYLNLLFLFLLAHSGFAQSNNDCSIPQSLPIGPTSGCISPVLATIDNTVTNSRPSDDPGCGDYNPTTVQDLWYTVVIPASGAVIVETSNDNSSIDDTVMAAYSGDCTNTLNLISCNDDSGPGSFFSTIKVLGTPASTVYIRVWSYDGFEGTFYICAYESSAPPPATNSDCIDAISLPTSATCDNPLVGSNNASNSSVPSPACGSYQGRDVWYKVVVPPNGDLAIETFEDDDLSIVDGALAVYSGSCEGVLIEEACDDFGNTNTVYDFGRIELLNKTPGETYYVRFWAYDNAELGTFKICAIDLDPVTAGVDDIVANSFKIYPNPVSNGKAILKFNSSFSSTIELSIYSIQGKQVLKINKGVYGKKAELDVSYLSKGMYFVKVENNGFVSSQKLIIQ